MSQTPTLQAGQVRIVATPIPASERSLAPDLARGLMLLFIALANVPSYLWGRALTETGMIEGSSTLSRIAHATILLFVENRSRPMFAILYGFGLAMIATRLMAKARAQGVDEASARGLARRLLARRSLWLMAFGALHACLLFFGDILFSYGLTGLIALAFVVASDTWLRVGFWVSAAWVTLIGMPLFAGLMSLTEEPGTPVAAPNGEHYWESLLTGVFGLGFDVALAGALTAFVPLALGGVLLFRAGWITQPHLHLTKLRLTFWGSMAVGVLSALPTLAIAMGWWETNGWGRAAAGYLNLLGGSLAGLGYICGFALLAHRLRGFGRRGPIRAVAALGARSLTGYLLQSIICAPLLSAWGFGLARDRGYAFAFAFAFGVWLTTVLVAYALDRAGRRGPFEVVLRRLSYR